LTNDVAKAEAASPPIVVASTMKKISDVFDSLRKQVPVEMNYSLSLSILISTIRFSMFTILGCSVEMNYSLSPSILISTIRFSMFTILGCAEERRDSPRGSGEGRALCGGGTRDHRGPGRGKLLMIYICNFHVFNNLLLIYICKLHWNLHRPMKT
jgi:hypothetical protein